MKACKAVKHQHYTLTEENAFYFQGVLHKAPEDHLVYQGNNPGGNTIEK